MKITWHLGLFAYHNAGLMLTCVTKIIRAFPFKQCTSAINRVTFLNHLKNRTVIWAAMNRRADNMVQDWRVCQTEIFITSCYNWLRVSASLEMCRTLWIKPCNANKHDFLQVSILNLSQALSSWCYSFFQGQMILHALWHFFISSTQPSFHLFLFLFFFPSQFSHVCVRRNQTL